MPKTDPVLAARAALGVAARRKDSAGVNTARRQLATAKIERAIRDGLAGPLTITDFDRERLAALLLAGGAK